MAYPQAYGQWAGNPKGVPPQPGYCCKELHDRYHPGGYQCTKRAGYGPDGHHCKVHDPAAVAARNEATTKKYRIALNKRIIELSAPALLAALQKIADGHNDPRILAKETIEAIKLRG